ncbi:MAG: hypothetical protein A3C44_05045 [Gammaproteobacteria bacterium RIFCSPHIGHO2_02_FULL_39_13]|nr:MAG: hypothetical protein A3C44_05045 [Gammaproteobacteria bacterium RIFCSPHIGHO2_02_FULL_39_13]OGT50564.1 MAG: hypothetical protein A3E53_03480 [Gammaproteobacteria bacterium RIFCSPHIGHO2_12_FULL_39_24]
MRHCLRKMLFCVLIIMIAATSALAAYQQTKIPPHYSALQSNSTETEHVIPKVSVSDDGATAVVRTPQFDAAKSNRYTGDSAGQRISLNFTNIKVRELLQIVAQFTKLNFVINDTVKGEMSIHLHQVPWTQALDVILKSQNLGERQSGNIVYIAPLSELMKQQIDELEAKQRMSDLVPLADKVIRLNYADAEEVQNILTTKNISVLSSRGTTSIDKRTNSVWIRDTPDHIKTITKLIKQIDHPVKQVMIEARIVNIDRKFERQLGARFGLTKPSQLSGTLQGANQLQVAQGNPSAVPFANRLNFNIPATGNIFGSTTPAGSIGLALAKLGSTFVDMELSALEQQNDLDIISSPRLITSNQQKAYIETGEQIPYQDSSSSGATTVQFVDALLKLEVTPQITPDNRVILDLKVTNNSAGTPISLNVPGGSGQTSGVTNTAGTAIPINKEEESSRILLNDNQTVVLGGVYERRKSNVVTRIPFLSKIPLLGNLFKNTDKSTDDAELLIFLTPHIIHKPSQASSSY